MKKLFLMAAMLLAGVCAFAQSNNNEPLKGDVNGDGKVDRADVNAVIGMIKSNLMLEYGKTVHYWYVGTTLPTDPSNPDENTGTNKWTTLYEKPDEIEIETTRISVSTLWYIAIPHSYGFQAYEMTGAELDDALYDKSQITINGVLYDLFTTTETLKKLWSIFKV